MKFKFKIVFIDMIKSFSLGVLLGWPSLGLRLCCICRFMMLLPYSRASLIVYIVGHSHTPNLHSTSSISYVVVHLDVPTLHPQVSWISYIVVHSHTTYAPSFYELVFFSCFLNGKSLGP
jgi:hypothetical protein